MTPPTDYDSHHTPEASYLRCSLTVVPGRVARCPGRFGIAGGQGARVEHADALEGDCDGP